jgi:desulfoferrodoxin (superoxide reductase-like protein)
MYRHGRRYAMMGRVWPVLLAAILLISQAAYAHPPSEIQLSYDKYSKTVKIKIDHPVTNTRTHFISEVKMFLNGEQVLDHKFKMQENEASHFLSYAIPDAENGDIVRVEAYCNSFGKKFGEVKIER